MPELGRITLPQNFYEWTSDQLLIAPEPQYVLADLILRALGVSLSVPDSVGLPGRTVGGYGADYTSAQDDQLVLEPDAISENLFAVNVDFNGQPGDAVRVNRPKYTDSTYTLASRTMQPGTAVSTTGIRVESEQALLKLQRLGGPYDTTAGEIRPYVFEKMVAQMGVHNIVKIGKKHIVRDFHKTLDTIGVDLGMQGATTLYPRGMTAANDATTAASYPLTYELLSRTAKYMDEDLKLPVLPDGKRIMVVTPTGEKQLKDDPQFARYAKDFETTNPLRHRYTALKYIIPEFYIFTSSTLDITANTSSVNVHTALAMAPGCFGIGMGEPPQVRESTNDNYGLSVPVIWTAVMAFAVMNSNFVVKVAYSADVN
jgi:hypothetical protein